MNVKSLKCSVEKTAVSGKTTYLVAGFEMEDGLPIQEGSKYKKAVEKGVQIINEDQLLKMIRDSDPEASARAETEEKKRREKERKEREAQQKKQLEQSQIPAGMKMEGFDWILRVIHSLLTTKYAPKQLAHCRHVSLIACVQLHHTVPQALAHQRGGGGLADAWRTTQQHCTPLRVLLCPLHIQGLYGE